MRLKSHESPRRSGRNDKGKGGSAKARQKRKTLKRLVTKLKSNNKKSLTSELVRDFCYQRYSLENFACSSRILLSIL
jgi:hypothetical protein